MMCTNGRGPALASKPKATDMIGFGNIGNPIFLQKILAEGGMIRLRSNDLPQRGASQSRYYGLYRLIIGFVFLSLSFQCPGYGVSRKVFSDSK